MKKLINPLVLILVICMMPGCSGDNSKTEEIPVIDFQFSAFTEVENVPIDTLVKSIEYVFLETLPESMIGSLASLEVTDDEILIISNRRVLIFDYSGRFKRQLGTQGRGPEEYNAPLNVMFDETNDIYVIYDYKHVLEFDSEYEFIRKLELPSNLKRIHLSSPGLYVADYRIEPFLGDSVVPSLAFLDKDYKIIKTINTSEPTDKPDGTPFMMDLMGNINYGSESMLFRHQNGDTIYRVSSDMTLEPYLILNYGDGKYPRELDFDMNRYMEEYKKYIVIGKFTVIGGSFVTQFNYDGKFFQAITNPKTGESILPVNTDTDMFGFVLPGFRDHNFVPAFVGGYLANVIQASDAKAHLDPDTDALSEDIKSRISQLKEEDNPVLVLCKY